MKRNLKIIGIVLFVLIVFIIGLGILYFITFNTNLWLKYPNPLKTQIAFVKLEFSSYNEICHEDCMLEQNILRKRIADYLIKEPTVMSSQIEDYLYDNDVINNFKIQLIVIAREGEEIKKERNGDYEIKIPDYLTKYLNSPSGNLEVKRQIMANFSEQIDLSANFLDDLFDIIKDENRNVDERITAMNDLRNIISEEEEGSAEIEGGPFPKYEHIKYKEICETLISIAEKNDNQQLKYAAVNNLYGCRKFEEYYTPELFDRLEKLFLQENIHIGVQDEILTTLYVYEDINKNKTVEIMKKIYNNQDINKFIRSEAGEALTEMKINGYPELDISEMEWDNFFIERAKIW